MTRRNEGGKEVSHILDSAVKNVMSVATRVSLDLNAATRQSGNGTLKIGTDLLF